MTITAEELALDKRAIGSNAGTGALYQRTAAKYIAEVERLQGLLDAKIDALPFGKLIRHFSGTEAVKMYELDRANQSKDAEIARLKDLLVRAYAFVRRAGVHSLADQIDAAVPREQHLNSSTSDPSGR